MNLICEFDFYYSFYLGFHLGLGYSLYPFVFNFVLRFVFVYHFKVWIIYFLVVNDSLRLSNKMCVKSGTEASS